MHPQKTIPQYLTEKQVSELTGLSIYTLRGNRFERKGIPYIKAGRAVRYCLDDILQYMESNKVQTKAK